MKKRIALPLLAAAWVVAHAPGQIPRGYEIIEVTRSPETEFQPEMNNLGQVVFGKKFSTQASREIFLYDSRTGELTQITDNNVMDTSPYINDAGTIVWHALIGPNNTGEIMVRSPEGIVTRLTDDDDFDIAYGINNRGQIVWNSENTRGCVGDGKDVMFFDGQTIRQITNNEWFNTVVRLNDHGEIIWAEFDICAGGVNWRSLIKLYSNGVVTTLSEPGLQAQYTTINNAGVYAWMFSDPVTSEEGIQIWQNGTRSLLTSWGQAPDLSDFGLSFTRWDEITASRHIWLHRNGEFRQLTVGPISNTEPVINNLGEVTWLHGSFPDLDLWVMRRFPPGDLNCDGAFNGADIDLFFLALGDPAAYEATLPNCDPLLGDMNGDGALNGADIDPFFAALGGG